MKSLGIVSKAYMQESALYTNFSIKVNVKSSGVNNRLDKQTSDNYLMIIWNIVDIRKTDHRWLSEKEPSHYGGGGGGITHKKSNYIR